MFISNLPPVRQNLTRMNKDELWLVACNRTTPSSTRRAAIRQWLVLDANPNVKLGQHTNHDTFYPPTLA